MPEAMDTVDTATAAGDFGTLVQAVRSAGLEDALRGEGPFTVFASTDAAFGALPEGTIEALLADPTGQLQQILLYHVLSGEILAEAVTACFLPGLITGILTVALCGASVLIGRSLVTWTSHFARHWPLGWYTPHTAR